MNQILRGERYWHLWAILLVLQPLIGQESAASKPFDRSAVTALYGRQCAACHGERGDGDGPLSPYLVPPPRDFASGVFNMVSTDNAIPTDQDLAHSIRAGLPGSAMPSFAWLTASQSTELAQYVRQLAVEGLVAKAKAIREHHELPIDEAELRRDAEATMTPGRSVAILPELPPTPETLDHGRFQFLIACAACHGVDGRGRDIDPAVRARFDIRLPRDFTSGLFRGGTSAAAIQQRIYAGMPAAGMPPHRLADADLQALIAYVRSLIPNSAKTRPGGQAVALTARRIEQLPADSKSEAWRYEALPMSPLRTVPDVVMQAQIAALHDGKDLAVLVRWPDGTTDRSLTQGPLPDAVAVQFSDAPEPPFLAMGSAQSAVHIWHWQAFVPRDVAGILDLLDSPLRNKSDASPGVAPRLRPKATSGEAQGQPTMPEFASRGKSMSVHHSWHDGHWHVLFRRTLQSSDVQEISFRSDNSYRFAVAIWNGSAGQRGPNKSVSGWHRLDLERD